MKNNIEYIDTAILGAGLAGLSAAYHSQGVLYEKEKEIGGTCRSLKIDGFVFDLGIHVLHTKNKYVLGLFAKKKFGLKKKARSAWIYSYGVLTKYPFQANTYGLPKYVKEECIAGFIDALNKTKQKRANYEDWIYATFGKGIADNFYLPYSEKFWTLRAKDLTTEWLDVRVPQPRLDQVIKGATSLQKEEFGPNLVFRYPEHGGIQRIAEGLVKKNTKVMLGKEACKIEPDKKIIHFNDSSAIRYKNLISTIPLPELINILDSVPQPVKQAACDLRHNSVLCVNLAVKRENISPYHWIYFPEKKYAAFRISFPRSFSQFTTPKKWSSIQAEVSYSKKRPIQHKDIVEKTVKDLIKAGILNPKDKIKLVGMKDIKYAYVIYDHSRVNNLKAINKFLKEHYIYNSGRFGQWEYLWMDEAIIAGRNAAAQIKSIAG